MRIRNPGAWIAAVSAAAFFIAMAGLFRDRLETGDIYPAYSTLRSDPVGCRAFYTALTRYPGLAVDRLIAKADLRGQDPDATIFFLGIDAEAFGYGLGIPGDLDSLARRGHRVVVGFADLAMRDGDEYRMRRAGLMDRKAEADSSKPEPGQAGKEPSGRKDERESAAQDGGEIAEKGMPGAARKHPLEWGLRIRIDTAFAPDSAGRAMAMGNAKDTLPWLGGVYFDSLQAPWTILYRRDGRAVAAERALGNGSLAILSDSYFATNQAQFHSDPSRLAARLLGGNRRVLFDERHLGVRQDESIAGLLRRYRLHWLLPSLLSLAALYAWKIRSAPAPVSGGAPAADAPDTRSALAGLLRRSLPGHQALETCVSLWKEHGSGKGASPSRQVPVPEIESILSARKADRKSTLASGYAEIQSILNRRKRT
jgi:hypothetical protein